jgi:hypothetical protein
MMKFHYTSLDDCHTAKGVVIVIDVLRAFSGSIAFRAGKDPARQRCGEALVLR